MINTSRRSGLRIAAASLAVLLTAIAPNATAQEPVPEQCLDAAICPIPYLRLAKQEAEPFLFLGKVVDEEHLRYGDYRRALPRFPDVRSCLMEKERRKGSLDLTSFDWNAMGDRADAEVCIFRIAASCQDPESFAAWLASQGFHSIEQGEAHRLTGQPPGTYLQGSWPVKEKGVLLGIRNFFDRMFYKYFSYSLIVSVEYRPVSRVYDTTVSYQSE